MDFKLVFTSIFLFILSWGTLQGFSQETQAATTAATVVQGGVSTDVIACMQKLMPCQPFMHSSSPPATCCSPLKEMVTEESQCLCKAFNDPKLLKTVNLTVDESLALSKACGIDVDVSMCKIATSPNASATVPSTSPLSVLSSSSDSSNTSDSRSNADIRIFDVRGSILFIASVALIVA